MYKLPGELDPVNVPTAVETGVFAATDIAIEWRGSGADEVGLNAANGDVLIEIDPRDYRPTEVDALLGDASKAKKMLGWSPEISYRSHAVSTSSSPSRSTSPTCTRRPSPWPGTRIDWP